MAIAGVGYYDYESYYAANKSTRTSPNSTRNTFETAQNSSLSHFTLHYFDDTEGNTALTAVSLGENGSVTVYKPTDYDAANPSYLVKYWDKDGNVQELRINPKKVDTTNASYLEMLAYTTYSDKQGFTKGAFGNFLNADKGINPSSTYDFTDIFDKQDYKQVIKEYMQMQYNANNLPGYLSLKQFYDSILQQESEAEDGKEAKEEKAKETSHTETEVIVNPDGSRVLLTTLHIGSMQATMSLELSKPTKLINSVNDKIQDDNSKGNNKESVSQDTIYGEESTTDLSDMNSIQSAEI